MPYWSSSRVGAVPQQPKTNSRYHRSITSDGSSISCKQPPQDGRKKGITMEDLKKQTALRLAHEQKQGSGPNIKPRGQQHPSPYPPSRSSLLGLADSTSVSSSSSAPYHPPYPRYDVVPVYPAQQPPPPVNPHRSSSATAAAPVPFVTSNNVSNHSINQQQSKLPHGLTVSELKEMTKARLQAEAAENHKDLVLLSSSSEHTPAVGGHSSLSSFPPTFGSNRNRTYSASRADTWSQAGESRADTWETGSVSTVASLGSELQQNSQLFEDEASPMPSCFRQEQHTISFISNNRRRAQTLSPRLGLTHVDEHVASTQFFPTPSSGVDRQHHLSPSSTPLLPAFSATSTTLHHQPRLSSRSSYKEFSETRNSMFSDHQHQQPVTKSRGRTLSASGISQSAFDPAAAGTNLGTSGVEEFNSRSRTMSAGGLLVPSYTHQEPRQCPISLSTGAGTMHFSYEQQLRNHQPIRGRAMSAVSLPAISPLHGNDHVTTTPVTGLADVFRDATATTTTSVPPGFDSPSVMNHDPRGRASTWSEGTESLFGQPLYVNNSNMSDDLAAILNLNDDKNSLSAAGLAVPSSSSSYLQHHRHAADNHSSLLLYPPPGL